MILKTALKEQAVLLRKQGKTYSEILAHVPVAKSTLSLWLRDVGLAKAQKQRLTQKRHEAQLRGGRVKRELRIQRQSTIQNSARKDIGDISDRELWLIGISLYWAEGSKEKEDRPGAGVHFTNSDPRMIKIFLKWLHRVCKVDANQIWFEVYLHEYHQLRKNDVIKYWSRELSISPRVFDRIYYKKGKVKTKRKNSTNDSYFGLLRVRVQKSSTLLRQITGWVQGIVESKI